MIYTCTSCRLILPDELAKNLKKCPVCGRTPNLDFNTADALLSQGYRRYDAPAPGPRTAPAEPVSRRRNRVSIPDVPVEAPTSSATQDAPQPPPPRGGNSRLDWMHQRQTPEPEPTPPPRPAPGPRNGPEPAPRQNPPQSGSSSSGSRSAHAPQSGNTAAPPSRRPGSSTPANTNGGTISGGPTGHTTDTGPFNPGNIDVSFIFQLLLLLAVSVVAGILIYSIWSMREQIIQTVTKIFTFVLIGAVAVFLLRRRH